MVFRRTQVNNNIFKFNLKGYYNNCSIFGFEPKLP